MKNGRVYPDNKPNIDSSIEPNLYWTKSNQDQFCHALIHCAAILFVFAGVIFAVLLYHIFEPFLHCILWSLLLGALLFPWKNRCTTCARQFLQQSQLNKHYLWFDLLIILPCQVFDRTFDCIGPICLSHWKECLLILSFRHVSELIAGETIYQYFDMISALPMNFDRFEWYIHHQSYWIPSMIVSLIGVLTFSNRSWLMAAILRVVTNCLWMVLLFYIYQMLPIDYRWIFVSLLILFISVGLISDRLENRRLKTKHPENRKSNSRKLSIITHVNNLIQAAKAHTRACQSSSPSALSIPYFSHLLCICIALKFDYFGVYLIFLVTLSFIYKGIRVSALTLHAYVKRQGWISERMIEFIRSRRRAFVPSAFYGLQTCLMKFDQTCRQYLQASLDYFISAWIIFALCLALLIGGSVFLLEMHQESVHLMTVTKQIITRAQIFENVLPNRDYLHDWIETVMNQVYLHGRTWITKQIGRIQPPRVEPKCCLPFSIHADDGPSMQTLQFGPGSLSNKNLEEEVLQLWDRFYVYMRNVSLVIASEKQPNSLVLNGSSNIRFSARKMIRTLQTILDFYHHDFFRLIHENLDTLRAVLDSFWSNTTLILTVFSTVFSLIVTGSVFLWNICLSWFIFLTLLFYFLSNSQNPIFQPLTWLHNLFGIGRQSLAATVNDVVTSVFVASVKMALFYGLYTYVVHSLFSCNLCFIPALLASVCAVILKPYLAVLPGCLDLWLVQQRSLSAILLLFSHILPVYIVDGIIHEHVIVSGHQYLTALSMAGGVYYRGLIGAFLGPIILCSFLVAIRLYHQTMVLVGRLNERSSPLFSTQIKSTIRRSIRSRTVSFRTDNENDPELKKDFSPST